MLSSKRLLPWSRNRLEESRQGPRPIRLTASLQARDDRYAMKAGVQQRLEGAELGGDGHDFQAPAPRDARRLCGAVLVQSRPMRFIVEGTDNNGATWRVVGIG